MHQLRTRFVAYFQFLYVSYIKATIYYNREILVTVSDDIMIMIMMTMWPNVSTEKYEIYIRTTVLLSTRLLSLLLVRLCRV